MKSLLASHHPLAQANVQLEFLEHHSEVKPFTDALQAFQLFPLLPTGLTVFQMNIGKMCNQTCRHCHVDAGPDRKEIMSLETMQSCLDILAQHQEFTTVDLTGGAPEMNPNFRWLVEQIAKLNRHIIVRCNLTIILANKKYYDLPSFFKQHKVEVISSLPFYAQDRTDRQRGDGVFKDSIKALKMLNQEGYGRPGTDLILNLVYNPSGAFLPGSQEMLESDYKRILKAEHDIEFNNLFTITNMPISRYLDYLISSNNVDAYMQKLLTAFNPLAAASVMCRNMISIGWNGYIYDCDFNQMLELKVDSTASHIKDFNFEALLHRNIVVHQHCYGCTAGSGSSCGGTIL